MPSIRPSESPLSPFPYQATDMKSHFSMVSLFNTKFSASGFHSSRSRSSSMMRSFPSHQGGSLPEMDEDLRRLVLQVSRQFLGLAWLCRPFVPRDWRLRSVMTHYV